jgi:hypothetical protein
MPNPTISRAISRLARTPYIRTIGLAGAIGSTTANDAVHAISFHSSIRMADRFRAQQDVLDSIEGWYEFCRSKKRPADIPVKPNKAYANSGWINWGHWLGNGQRARILDGFRPFPKAKAFVRTLKIENQSDWYKWTRSGAKPDDIPARPEKVYADKGWISYCDWLGNGRRTRGAWRPFKQARAFVRTLGLMSQPQWRAYRKSDERPADIPADPDRVYANDGWIDYNDWLGSDGRRVKWRPFKQARAFVCTLELKNEREWRGYRKSDERPADIPTDPARIYADDGWAGMSDWLGA